MLLTLLRKELHQHGHATLALAIVMAGGAELVVRAADQRGASGSAFDGARLTLMFILPLAGLALSQRLVALEYREKTQLFLEGLPIPRWWMVALKYLFGLAVMLLLAGVALGVAAVRGGPELFTPRFVAILAARAAGWTWFIHSALFLTGFLGRYRFLFLLAAGSAYALVDHFTALRLGEFGPLALIDARFAYENAVFPRVALRETAILCGGLVALSFMMGLVREGSVAAMLGEKMSHREKMLLSALALGGLGSFVVVAERAPKAPYDLPGAIEESRGPATVKVGVADDKSVPRSAVVAARTADDLAALAEYLALAEMPPVFVSPRADFGADQFERVELEDEEGVLVRANFAAAEFPERRFFGWLAREVISARSHGRAEREPKRWVLDGFTLFWERRENATQPLDADADLAGRALGAVKSGFGASELRRWLTFRARAGEANADAVAWAALRTLARRRGPETSRDFLRTVLSPKLPHDVRATWHDLRHPLRRLLEKHAGMSESRLAAECLEELAATR